MKYIDHNKPESPVTVKQKRTPKGSPKGQWLNPPSYLSLPSHFYHKQGARVATAPKLVIANDDLAKELGFDSLNRQGANHEDAWVGLGSGSKLPLDTTSFSQAYAGHQFGHFTMLGDGRALVLGEFLTPKGKLYDIQLKGSGLTPYSRGGDGLAALGPMLREYLISEAMAALNIPTSRSLMVVTTGDKLWRNRVESGAILTRVAASHLRVGTLEYAAAFGQLTDLATLVTYSLTRHYPKRQHDENTALALLEEVGKRQVELIAEWIRVGFIHGVMNTDNMSLSGITFDYGPCAFLDHYDPNRVFSSIDHQGRYRFMNQMPIGLWNLTRLAEALLPLISQYFHESEAIIRVNTILQSIGELMKDRYARVFRQKLGLKGKVRPRDESLANDFLGNLQRLKGDYTNSFAALSQLAEPSLSPSHLPPFQNLSTETLFRDEEMQEWLRNWRARLAQNPGPNPYQAAVTLMARHNPLIIPRNHLVERAIQAAETDPQLTEFKRLLSIIKKPYQCESGDEIYQQPDPAGDSFRTFCGT